MSALNNLVPAIGYALLILFLFCVALVILLIKREDRRARERYKRMVERTRKRTDEEQFERKSWWHPIETGPHFPDHLTAETRGAGSHDHTRKNNRTGTAPPHGENKDAA